MMAALAVLAYVELGPIGVLLGVIAGVLGLVLLAGLLAGQFRKGVVQELRDSLSTANTELDIERKRGDRLEEAVREMERRLGSLEAENRVLRETLQTGLRLAPEFGELVKEAFRRHEVESERLVIEEATKTREQLARSLETVLQNQAAFEDRVTRRVRLLITALADSLEEPQKTQVARTLVEMAADDAAKPR